MAPIKALLRDPLTHFVLAGGLAFAAFWLVGKDDSADPRHVVVDREALLTFIQYRTKAFDPGVADNRLDALTESQLTTLIDDYVREEVLHREALAMGLDDGDYIIRRRLVQKIEFIAEGFAASAAPASEVDLRNYFQQHSADYYTPPVVTFAHVFFDATRRAWAEARDQAAQTLEALRLDSAAFSDATRYGDRFLYHVNYVEREQDDVGGHFGAEMATAIFALPASEGEWQGPLESPHGVHLVLLTQSVPGRLPAFEEVRDRVVDDARRHASRSLQQQALQAIVDSYEVDIDVQRAGG